jgi:hypothetical protein
VFAARVQHYATPFERGCVLVQLACDKFALRILNLARRRVSFCCKFRAFHFFKSDLFVCIPSVYAKRLNFYS